MENPGFLAQTTSELISLIPVAAGAVLALATGKIQARHAESLKDDRARRAHYEKILGLLIEEREKELTWESTGPFFSDVRLALKLTPPAESRRQKTRMAEVQRRCLESLDWVEEVLLFPSPTFLLADIGHVYRDLVDDAIDVIGAAFQGAELPGRPSVYSTLAAAQERSDEYWQLLRDNASEE